MRIKFKMNILFTATVFVMLYSVCLCDDDFSLKDSVSAKKTLCRLFPKSLEKECDEMKTMRLLRIPDRKKSDNCVICRHITQFVGHNIDTSKSPSQLQQLLLATCQVFASPMKENCVRYCNEEGSKLVEKLLRKEKVKRICKIDRDCLQTEPKKTEQPIEDGKMKNPLECLLCKEIMTAVEKLLNKNSTMEEIVVALEKVCWMLPASRTNQCIDFVDKYTKQMIEFLLAGHSPDMVCRLMMLCSSSGDTVHKDSLYFLPETTIL